jgi:hypothetical protein
MLMAPLLLTCLVPSRSRVVRNPVRQCSSNAGTLQQFSERQPGGWKAKNARAMLCYLAMILCPAVVWRFGGCCSQRRGCRTEQLRSSVQIHTWANGAFLLVIENYRGCKRRTPWLEPHEEGVVGKVADQPPDGDRAPHPEYWHCYQVDGPLGFWRTEVPAIWCIYGVLATLLHR